MTKQGREFMQRVARGEFLSIPERRAIAVKTLDVESSIPLFSVVGQVGQEDGVAYAIAYVRGWAVMTVRGDTYEHELRGGSAEVIDDTAIVPLAKEIGTALHKAYPAFTSERDDA